MDAQAAAASDLNNRFEIRFYVPLLIEGNAFVSDADRELVRIDDDGNIDFLVLLLFTWPG